MQPRRSLRLVAGALVLALPLLSSCGFGKATDRVYTQAEGINHRTGPVAVLNAVVVAAQPDSGTFIASLSNNSGEDENSFESLAGAGEWQDLTVADFDPVDLPVRGFANLADEGIAITGDFGAGDVMSLTLTFGSGDTVTMNVPVIYACDEYTGLDSSTGGSSEPSEEPEESESPSPGEVPTDDATPTEDESSAAAPSSEDTYDCAVVLEEE